MVNIETRIAEMLKEQADERGCTIEQAGEALDKEWGKGGSRGYGVFFSNDSTMAHIERIDELGVYDGDLEAGEQAEKDGMKLIPVNEIPDEYPINAYRYLDNEGNREILGLFC